VKSDSPGRNRAFAAGHQRIPGARKAPARAFSDWRIRSMSNPPPLGLRRRDKLGRAARCSAAIRAAVSCNPILTLCASSSAAAVSGRAAAPLPLKADCQEASPATGGFARAGFCDDVPWASVR
jgi:hypothetical protein